MIWMLWKTLKLAATLITTHTSLFCRGLPCHWCFLEHCGCGWISLHHPSPTMPPPHVDIGALLITWGLLPLTWIALHHSGLLYCNSCFTISSKDLKRSPSTIRSSTFIHFFGELRSTHSHQNELNMHMVTTSYFPYRNLTSLKYSMTWHIWFHLESIAIYH